MKPLFKKVLVAYNGSRSSLHAAMYAIMLAKQFKCEVKVVYVVDVDTIKKLTLTKFLVQDEAGQIEGGLQADGDRNLAFVVKLAKSKGVAVETELRRGAVWSQVITAADEFGADVILLGEGGRQSSQAATIRHELVSSYASGIIGSAHCSVMVARHPQIEGLFKLS